MPFRQATSSHEGDSEGAARRPKMDIRGRGTACEGAGAEIYYLMQSGHRQCILALMHFSAKCELECGVLFYEMPDDISAVR